MFTSRHKEHGSLKAIKPEPHLNLPQYLSTRSTGVWNLFFFLKHPKMIKTLSTITLNFLFVLLGFVEVESGCIPIERVDGVGVGEQLWQERLKDVGQICNKSRQHAY